MLVSVGMGITNTTIEGQRFGALNDPISNSLGAPIEDYNNVGVINSLFSTTRMSSDGNFVDENTNDYFHVYNTTNNDKSAKINYLDSVFNNPSSNTANIYENALNNANNLFKDVETFLTNVMQRGNSKKSLLTKSGLFARVLADFGLLVENLGTGNGDPTDVAIQFALMRKLAGAINSNSESRSFGNNYKKWLKIYNQQNLARKLKQSLPENYNDDLISQSRIIRINHGSLEEDPRLNAKKIQTLRSSMDYLADGSTSNSQNEKEFDFLKIKKLLIEGNLKNNSKRNENINDIVVQIVKDIESESYEILNSIKPQGTFLRSNRTTNYSGFDSLTIANIVYECFALLAHSFTDASIKRKVGTTDKFIVSHSGTSGTSVGVLEKSGRFFGALANAISNKNTDFLIKKDVITTDNVTRKTDPLSLNGKVISASEMIEISNIVLAEDEVFWNLYAIAKSVMSNIRASAAPIFRYGRLFNKGTSSTVSDQKSHEKTLLSFINDSDLNSANFLQRLNEISLNRAKLRLREIEAISKPYDMADLPDRVYDACEVFLKSKNNYNQGKSLIYALSSNQLDDLLNNPSKEFNPTLKTKISRVSKFEPEVKYADLLLPSIVMRYVVTETELSKAVDDLTEDGSGSYSFETLALRVKYYDLFKGDYVNLDATLAVPLLESYLNCKLFEVCFDVSLEPQDLISDGFEWNRALLRSVVDVLAAKLGVNNLFDHAFVESQGRLLPRNEEQLNSKIKQETARFDSEQGQYYVNNNINFETISAVHNLVDSLIFKQSMVKKMIFSIDKFDGIYSAVFDQGSAQLTINSNNKKFDVDFMDTYYVSGEIS
jgi:hypothetical protein